MAKRLFRKGSNDILFGRNRVRVKRGLSLLELLTALIIIAILIAGSVPLYNRYVVRARRTAAQSVLIELASALQDHYTTAHEFSGVTLAGLGMSEQIVDGYYRLAIVRADKQHYLIEAIPQGSQATLDASCGRLQFDDLGNRGVVGGDGQIQTCW